MLLTETAASDINRSLMTADVADAMLCTANYLATGYNERWYGLATNSCFCETSCPRQSDAQGFITLQSLTSSTART